MAIDIRATVSCSLGTIVSGSVSDGYVQGQGLILTSGSVVISGLITPAIGTVVTFSYVKAGVTRTIPRRLRVLSSFADPFRRTTSVELGCTLTYLQDKKEAIDWTAYSDPANTLTTTDAKIITIPIRAQGVAQKCLTELGITGSFTLTNPFSIERFDFSGGYVQVLGNLLVSESQCGYLDASDVLQVFSLDQAGGTGPVIDTTQLIDLSKIGAGQLPGEAVTVSYSSLRLKRDVNQTEDNAWEAQSNSASYQVNISYSNPATGAGGVAVFSVLETTEIFTTYAEIVTSAGERLRVVAERQTTFTTNAAAVVGNVFSEYLSNGLGANNLTLQKYTRENYGYDKQGNEEVYDKVSYGAFGFMLGGLSVPTVFDDGSYVSWNLQLSVSLERERRETITIGNSQQVTTTVYGPWPKSLAGQQAVATGRLALTSTAEAISYANGVIGAGLCLIDHRVESRTTTTPESAPTRAEVNNSKNAKGGSPNNGYRTESKASLSLAMGSATAQRRTEFSLPYAPDDRFFKAGNIYYSAASDAPQKAQQFGLVQNRLLLGNRNGMNIQAAPEVLPAAPFAAFVIRSGGVSGLYRTNGTSWTFDDKGLVASTDALFWGGVGGTGPVFFPVAPGITSLPAAPSTSTVNILDSGGNVVGSYQQMAVSAVVPVWQETRALAGALTVSAVVTGFDYPLQVLASVVARVKTTAVVSRINEVSSPVAAFTIAGVAPTVSTGARVAPPTATTQVTALVPVVSTGAAVLVPAAGIAVTGLDPQFAGRQKTTVQAPVANVLVAGMVPAVSRGARVVAPAAGISMTALTPTIYDSDALRYMTSVEIADGQSLETAVKDSIDVFVRGCKADGTWAAIKASCILAGARTLTGALTPLMGTAPANNGFVAGDYDRKTGLIGNGSTKYLDANRANNADPQDSQHLAVWVSSAGTVSLGGYIGDLTSGQTGASYLYRNNSGAVLLGVSRTTSELQTTLSIGGLVGVNRSASGSFSIRSNGSTQTANTASATPSTGSIHVFRLNRTSGNFLYTNARLAFYSVGESIDLAALGGRVATLISAFASAI